jgi:plasmid stability protein
MAGLLQIRNVPDETRRELKARAADRGQSLNDYLLGLLAEEVRHPTFAELTARIAARSERLTRSSVDDIRAERDARS